MTMGMRANTYWSHSMSSWSIWGSQSYCWSITGNGSNVPVPPAQSKHSRMTNSRAWSCWLSLSFTYLNFWEKRR